MKGNKISFMIYENKQHFQMVNSTHNHLELAPMKKKETCQLFFCWEAQSAMRNTHAKAV